MYNPERITELCILSINIPENYKTGTSLEGTGSNTWQARNYYTLADSPLLASPDLKHLTYDAEGVPFHILIYGDIQSDPERLISDFKRFSAYQIREMGDFPESAYHFLLITMPYKLYHGVEHGASTVICLGPSAEVGTSLYDELLGISSHELFHAWNILKIRPVELMPYRFNEVPVFNTGFVAEGFTTYFGDLMLVRSGVKDEQWFFNELAKLFKRHYENFGRQYTSVADSSIDLWVDGYQVSAPHRKSSIYVEGAIVALILDLSIRSASGQEKSLIDLMLILYNDFAKFQKGYTAEQIQSIAEQLLGRPAEDIFNNYVYGLTDTRDEIDKLLLHYGLQISEKQNENILERCFGMRLSESNGQWKIVKTCPGSPAEAAVRPDDVIIEINGAAMNADLLTALEENECKLAILRKGSKKEILLTPNERTYFPNYVIEVHDSGDSQEARMKWLKDETP